MVGFAELVGARLRLHACLVQHIFGGWVQPFYTQLLPWHGFWFTVVGTKEQQKRPMSSKQIKPRHPGLKNGSVPAANERVRVVTDITPQPDFQAILERVNTAMEFLAPQPGKIVIAPTARVKMIAMSPLPEAVVVMFLHSIGDVRSLLYQLNAASEYVGRLEGVVKALAEDDPDGVVAASDSLESFYALSPHLKPEWWPEDEDEGTLTAEST